MFVCYSGSWTKAQHYPADVRRESRGGWRAASGPGGCKEHVQNTNRWTAEKPETMNSAHGLAHTDCKQSFTVEGVTVLHISDRW